MKLNIKQLNKIKKFIKNENGLEAVYASSKGLWFSDYYKCWNFEYEAVNAEGDYYGDLTRFETNELLEIINK